MAGKDVTKLRDQAAAAVERGKLDKAIELYGELEVAEPNAPNWPKRIGETYRRSGDNARAVAAFERAAEKYVLEGFLVQAIAVCTLILQINPAHPTAAARLAELVPARQKRTTTKPPVPPTQQPLLLGTPVPPIPRATAIPPPKPVPVRESAIPLPSKPVPIPRAAAIPPPKPVPVRDSLPTLPLPPVPVRDSLPTIPLPPKPVPVRDSLPTIPLPPRPVPVRESVPAIILDEATVRSEVRIEIPPGSGLDAIDFSTLIPNTQRIVKTDGTLSGITLLPLDDDFELSLDDAEITLDPGPDGPSLAARQALLTTPLFPGLPPGVLEALIGRMALLHLDPGEILFREGETGHALFVISEGEVAVESVAVGELARLGPSAFFGEIALVTDLPRSATIRAVTRVELLAIDREVMRDALAAHPEILTVMLRFVRDRLIDRITRTSELFQPFTEQERQELSKRFELVEVVPDEMLITEGERADGLYLVVAGKVEVQRTGGDVLATLGSGDVFGELSLLANTGSTASVRSVGRVLALRLPTSTFQEVIMTHPQVLAYLGELAERRTPRALAEEEEFVDLHLDMLV